MNRFARTARWLPILLLALTLLWYVVLVLRFQTHGAIGDDPATYVQMALDLAQHGTVIHEFSLFTNLFDIGLSWDAFLTPGYHVVPTTGVTVPNFAFGFPLLLAAGYRIFGEGALYLATPLMGALSLVFTFGLARELWTDFSPTARNWIGALAALLLATTPKQIQLALVPMSDVPTQLFCVIAIWCAVRIARPNLIRFTVNTQDGGGSTSASNIYVFAALTGLVFGFAYSIRHSALVLIIPLAYIVARWGSTKHKQISLIFVAVVMFALTILPDVLYHIHVLGSPFAVESPESTQTDWLGAPVQLFQMLVALFSMTGMGPILLLAPLGIWQLWRTNNRFAATILVTWCAAFILFHAPLRLTGVFENSLRYLLPVYPALAFVTATGIVTMLEWGWRALRPRRKPYQIRLKPTRWEIALLGALAALFLFIAAIRAVAGPERFVLRAYGWMSGTAREDLNTLSQQLPPNAVIGVSDQMAGAAMLYVQRDIFRPANFLEPAREFPQFRQAMQSENRPVYLLGDWNCSPLANAGEMLPMWLEGFRVEATGEEIRDLPYECAQRVRRLAEE